MRETPDSIRSASQKLVINVMQSSKVPVSMKPSTSASAPVQTSSDSHEQESAHPADADLPRVASAKKSAVKPFIMAMT